MDDVPDLVTDAAEVLGDRWTLLILRDIIFEDRRNFRALLLGSREGIASNILADRLVRLVDAGLLVRGEGRRGQRATYSLTEAGVQTAVILHQLAQWAARWRGTEDQRNDRSADPPDTIGGLMADLRRRHVGAGQ